MKMSSHDHALKGEGKGAQTQFTLTLSRFTLMWLQISLFLALTGTLRVCFVVFVFIRCCYKMNSLGKYVK